MGRTKRLDYEQVVFLCGLKGLTTAQAAEQVGAHPDTVQKLMRAFNLCRLREFQNLVSLIDSNTIDSGMIRWCFEYLDIGIPREVLDAFDRQKENKRLRNLAEQKKSAAVAEPALPTSATDSAPVAAIDPVYLIRIIENQNKEIELLQSLIDVVIPGWTQEIKKSNNSNSDMLYEPLKALNEKVEKMSCRLRKFNGS